MEKLGASSYIPALVGHPDGSIFAAATTPGPVEVRPDGTLVPPVLSTQESTIVWRISPTGGRAWTRAFNDPMVGVPYQLSTSPWTSEASLIIGSVSSFTKVSASGERLWTTTCDTWVCDRDPNSATRVPAVTALADGGALVADTDNRLIRLDANGAVAWTSTVVQENICAGSFYMLAEDADGTLLLGGNIPSACDGAQRPAGMTVLRLDATGGMIGKRIVPAPDDRNYAVLAGLGVAPDGSILANGVVYGSVDFGDGTGKDVLPFSDYGRGFAMRMSRDFSPVRLVEAPLRGLMMVPTFDGGLMAVDHRSSIGKGSPADPYLFKMDADLNLSWAVSAGSADTQLYSLAVAGDRAEVAGFGTLDGYYGTFLSRYRY